MPDDPQKPFWEAKTLSEMTEEQWEALCDGCGKCCVVLLQDDETDEIWETDVSCKLYDCKTRRCRGYEQRRALVPSCVHLTPDNLSSLSWMPETCAYKLLAEGKPLEEWHPLISGRRESVAEAGIATPPHMPSELEVTSDDLEDHVYARRWPRP